MQVRLDLLRAALQDAPQEETVDATGVNPYLINEVLRPLQRGESLCYGQVDFSGFEADDLRALSYYCDSVDSVSRKLKHLTSSMASVEPRACAHRAFC